MQNSFRPIQELKRTPHTYSSEVEKEPIYNLIKELSKAQGKVKALEFYSSDSEIKRLQKLANIK